MTTGTARAAPSLWRLVGSTAAARVIVMGIGGVVGLFTARLIIGHYGTVAYSQYGLLTQLPSLLPFADLGMAAVLFNTIGGSQDPRKDPSVRQTITTVFRVLIVFAAMLILVAIVITWGGWWRFLLGSGLTVDASPIALWCLIVFALALPLSIGPRILVALRQAHKQVLTQIVVAPILFCLVGLTVLLHLRAGNLIAAFAYIATAVGTLLCFLLALRMIRPQIGAAVKDIHRLRAVPNVKVMGTAWPQLVQMIALPIAMQTDRLLLSHFGTGQQLAQYTLASQLFGIVVGAIGTGASVLWPIYARARATQSVETPYRPVAAFVAGALIMSGAVAIVAPWLASIVADGSITLDPWLLGGFVAFVAVQAAKYPLGMYLTDPRGLKLQVPGILVLAPVNLFVSWKLISLVGAGGPIIGSALSVFLCQVLPYASLVRRDLRRRRAEAAEADQPSRQSPDDADAALLARSSDQPTR